MGRWASKSHRNTIKDEIYRKLTDMLEAGKGRSRQLDKKAGIAFKYIYSFNTYHTYRKESRHFCTWILERHPECRHLKDCRRYVNEWLQFLIDCEYSAYTISTRKAAMAKLFQVDYSAFIETPGRYRGNVKRSRQTVEYDRNISEATEAKLASITKAIGARRSEITRITGDDLVQDEYTDTYYIVINKGTKGGKERLAEIMDPGIVELLKQKGSSCSD